METNLTFFVGIYILYAAVQILIAFKQYRFLELRSAQEPVILNAASWKEAAQYGIAKEKFSIFSNAFGLLVFLIWAFWGLGALDAALDLANPYAKAVAFVLAFMAVGFVLDLPFDYYAKFVLDARFGFNKSTKELFITDKIKGALLAVLIIAPLVYAVAVFVESFKLWWLYTFFALFALVILINMFYPTLRALLFDKFESIESTDLGASVKDLLQAQGFSSSGIFKVDASKRDARLNAYFGGLGKTKRVVLFDTLIDKLTRQELLAVLGHELGHFKHKDIVKNIFLIGFLLFFVLLLFGNTPAQSLNAFGLEYSPASLIVFFLIFSPIVFFFVAPLTNYLSQSHEFAADDFGAAVQDRRAMASALVKLSDENKSFPLAHRLYSIFYHTHPSVAQRVQRLRQDARS
ncbi:MAG: M48 family metallopeptidase [Helicobacteraceae bacterium]